MTDFPPRDPDQLASDLVDGLLPPAEAARARRDPEIAARAARIEQLRSTLRSVPPADPHRMSRAIGAAVAAAQADSDPERVALHAVRAPRSSVPLPSRRTNRPWLAAAAALLVAGVVTAGLVAGISSGNDDDNEANDSAAVADQAPEEPMAGEADDIDDADDSVTSVDGQESSGGGDLNTAGEELDNAGEDLGTVANSDELAALVRRRATSVTPDSTAPTADGRETPAGEGASPTTSRVDSAAGSACPGLTASGNPARGTAVYVATATLDGSPVRVHVYEQDGKRRLVATDQSCADVVDVPFGS